MKQPILLTLAFCLSSSATACVFGYHRVNEPIPTKPEEVVQVWTHGQLMRLHDSSMLLDSITGIPVGSPWTCDACRIGLALTDVDSVRVRRNTTVIEGAKALGQSILASYLWTLIP
jgi:hypothetical protein